MRLGDVVEHTDERVRYHPHGPGDDRDVRECVITAYRGVSALVRFDGDPRNEDVAVDPERLELIPDTSGRPRVNHPPVPAVYL
jgi:hypothetical protein